MTLNRRPLVLVGVILLLVAGAIRSTVAQSRPGELFEGEWKTDVPSQAQLNVMSSRFVISGLSIAVTGDKVRITQHHVGPKGPWRSFETVLQTDGKTHVTKADPKAGRAKSTQTTRWLGPYLLEHVSTVPRRTVLTTYSLSADQKTLTLRSLYSDIGYTAERMFYR